MPIYAVGKSSTALQMMHTNCYQEKADFIEAGIIAQYTPEVRSHIEEITEDINMPKILNIAFKMLINFDVRCRQFPIMIDDWKACLYTG